MMASIWQRKAMNIPYEDGATHTQPAFNSWVHQQPPWLFLDHQVSGKPLADASRGWWMRRTGRELTIASSIARRSLLRRWRRHEEFCGTGGWLVWWWLCVYLFLVIMLSVYRCRSDLLRWWVVRQGMDRRRQALFAGRSIPLRHRCPGSDTTNQIYPRPAAVPSWSALLTRLSFYPSTRRGLLQQLLKNKRCVFIDGLVVFQDTVAHCSFQLIFSILLYLYTLSSVTSLISSHQFCTHFQQFHFLSDLGRLFDGDLLIIF